MLQEDDAKTCFSITVKYIRQFVRFWIVDFMLHVNNCSHLVELAFAQIPHASWINVHIIIIGNVGFVNFATSDATSY